MKTDHGSVFELDIKSIQEDGTFTGYASVFDVVDSHKDIVVKSAFKKSLVKRPAAKVKMLREHDQTEPIGKWLSLVEDDRGLKATGQLILGTTKGSETYKLMKAGLLDSLSIGYRTVRDRMDRTKGARILEQVDLWEISVVTFPSNTESTVTAVKSNSATQFRELVAAINSARNLLH
ncbi:prohead peptidase, Unknown type peptidase, MEROPS family U35 [Nitrobacter hamburgensis X14]|uniref:Prohead serine protease domain-containing protein n=1 Tax=Nitrobacter hamburgensis (strain DSM 10229 / NCIMB 13809 / X14) TaxID=323097 RepID=Q1QML3_NITHX|nr:HK97 family phage prohead protease [Nitrobacter hamburgensis]ABE62534.1 prohead peptidase, Unknown type peptidase, MEROPS family U35 [Nitrobacter hamburgensis X14]